MKILRKPKPNPVTCSVCGCVFVPGKKEWRGGIAWGVFASCPYCKNEAKVTFDTSDEPDRIGFKA